MLPYVPIADRVRVGVAMFSYRGTLNFGITADYDTTPDLQVLADGIVASMAELVHGAAVAASEPLRSQGEVRDQRRATGSTRPRTRARPGRAKSDSPAPSTTGATWRRSSSM